MSIRIQRCCISENGTTLLSHYKKVTKKWNLQPSRGRESNKSWFEERRRFTGKDLFMRGQVLMKGVFKFSPSCFSILRDTQKVTLILYMSRQSQTVMEMLLYKLPPKIKFGFNSTKKPLVLYFNASALIPTLLGRFRIQQKKKKKRLDKKEIGENYSHQVQMLT